MIDYFREYIEGVGVIELEEVKIFTKGRVGIKLIVHGDRPRTLELIESVAKKLDECRFSCRNVREKTLEIHFINRDNLPVIDKEHPFMKALVEGIKSKTKYRPRGLVHTGRFSRPADFD